MSGPLVTEVPASAVIDLRHRVLREGRPRETAIWEGDDAASTKHYALTLSDRVLAIASVMAAPFPDRSTPTAQLRGMAVDPDHQGQGLGSTLLRGIQDVHKALWCNARLHAVAFYERHGWTVQSERFEVPLVGPHVRMVWLSDAGSQSTARP
ncbi:MAG: GNAT family N-acetyltransferase [Myxococcota bacterium]